MGFWLIKLEPVRSARVVAGGGGVAVVVCRIIGLRADWHTKDKKVPEGRPGHETSRDKTGLGPGTSRGLAGGSRDISRHYSSGPEMSRDFYSPGTIQKSRDFLPSS